MLLEREHEVRHSLHLVLVSRCLLTLCPGDGPPALATLARVIQEQCLAHYAADAQRRLGVHAGKVGGPPMVDSQLRVAFKVSWMCLMKIWDCCEMRLSDELVTCSWPATCTVGGMALLQECQHREEKVVADVNAVPREKRFFR